MLFVCYFRNLLPLERFVLPFASPDGAQLGVGHSYQLPEPGVNQGRIELPRWLTYGHGLEVVDLNTRADLTDQRCAAPAALEAATFERLPGSVRRRS